MGCKKLTYYEEGHLGNFGKNLEVVYAKSGFSGKKGCNYYAFGSLQPGRYESSDEYRYGFGGQEKDDEINGVEGSSYTAEHWQYDSRLGRRWNVDPIDKSWRSSYDAFNNSPIWRIDPNGDHDYTINKKGKVKRAKKTKDNFDMVYTRKDYEKGVKENGVKINDKTILPQLGKVKKDISDQDVRVAKGNEKSMNDVFRLFQFASDNTDSEWSGYTIFDWRVRKDTAAKITLVI